MASNLEAYAEYHTTTIKALLSQKGAPVVEDLLRRGRNVETRAKHLITSMGAVDTGRLRSSITSTLVSIGSEPAVRVGTNVNYAMFVHEGTGVYGPYGRPITPKSSQFLVFTPRGAKSPVFARSVKGMKGRPFLKDALPAAFE